VIITKVLIVMEEFGLRFFTPKVGCSVERFQHLL